MCHISVIIPTYNRKAFIENAVRSVLAQTYQDFEILIVDDGSTDDTSMLVATLAEQDPRINYLRHDTNRGAQAARNTGILAAKGEWIAFLDSDDQWLSDSLEVRLQLATAKQLHVVHSDCYVLTPASTTLQPFGVPQLQGQVYRQLLRGPGPMFPSLLVSKEALTRIGYLDETIISYQEWDTAIRLAKCYRFAFVSEPSFLYDCRHEDTISKNVLREAKGYEQVFAKHRASIMWYLGPKALASHYQTAASMYRKANEGTQAHRCLLMAILVWPFRPKTILRKAQHFFRIMSG